MADIVTDKFVDKPHKLKIQPRICEKCGAKYVPTGTRQTICPDCKAGKKHNPEYIKARQSGEVKSYNIETPERMQQAPETPEITRQVIETPEDGTWYECRIRRGNIIMMDAKISPELWAMILDAIK